MRETHTESVFNTTHSASALPQADPSTPLEYKGVVLNEMKGVMSWAPQFGGRIAFLRHRISMSPCVLFEMECTESNVLCFVLP